MGEVGEWLPTVRSRVYRKPTHTDQYLDFCSHHQVALGGGDSLRSVVETLHQAALHMGGVVGAEVQILVGVCRLPVHPDVQTTMSLSGEQGV